MKKTTVENIAKILPSTLKNVTGYFKNNFEKSGQDTLSNVTGTVGIFIKFFAQDTIDTYFEKLSKEKLEDYGSNIYLQASLLQVGKSMEYLNDEAIQVENAQSVVILLIDTLDEVRFNPDDILTIFTPQYHPIVVFVKEKMEELLEALGLNSQVIDNFTSSFNDNIEDTVKEVFGDEDYAKHKEEIKEFLLNEHESKLLHDMYELRKIGFKEGESLLYEEAYASWKPIDTFWENEEDLSDDNHREVEESLEPVKKLIEQYFEKCSKASNCTNHLLFTVADFGKGKSVFLKQYASELAQSYARKREGYIPIYFNLRDFHHENYVRDSKLGILESYLDYVYSINIDDEYFRQKNYIFLIDSLDESGVLTKESIDSVIESVRRINSMNGRDGSDGAVYKRNRMVIATRPFSDILKPHLTTHNPHTVKNENNEEIIHYLSLYGFKEEQFNSWLINTLKNDKKIKELSTKGFAKEILESIKKDEPINIYQKLLDEETLSRTELRRPIFSYMIYQLILNKVDFVTVGKIGVYLSFINLLTKKAKYVNDKDISVNQKDERSYRNILHSIASLWMYKRQQGEQGILDKYEVCHVLDGKKEDRKDEAFLKRHEKVIGVEFFSNSYFGENSNKLYFQHQSFAEILLAEYYLKVFIKYALEEQVEIDEARKKLILGEPTEQTIQFFKELLELLKETVNIDLDEQELIEKRRLLYPLFSSLATQEHNTLFSNAIYYGWFKNCGVKDTDREIPDEVLKNWAIDKDDLEKIMKLAQKIIDSKTTFLLAQTESTNSLFDNELTVFQNAKVSDSPTDMDKWLALVVGNLLHDDVPEERDFFNGRLESPENLFEMIRGWNYSMYSSAPWWAKEYFKGIIIENIIFMDNVDFSHLNFSFSKLKNIYIHNSTLSYVNFSNTILDSSSFVGSLIDSMNLSNVTLENNINFSKTILEHNILFPELFSTFLNNNNNLMDYYELAQHKEYLNKSYINISFILEFWMRNLDITLEEEIKMFFPLALRGMFSLVIENKSFSIDEIKSCFAYENEQIKKDFEKWIDGLGEFEVQ